MYDNSTSDSNTTLSMPTHGTNGSNVSTLDAIDESDTIELGCLIEWTVAFLCTVPIVALVTSALDILNRKQIQMTTNPYYFVFFLLSELACLLVVLILSLLCIIGVLSYEIILVAGVMCAAMTMSSSMLLLTDRYMYMKRGIEYDLDTSIRRSKLIIPIVFISCVAYGLICAYTLDTPVRGFVLLLIILEIAFGCFNIIFNINIYYISARSLTIQQELDFQQTRNKKVCLFLVNLLVTTCVLIGGGMVLTLRLYILKIHPTYSLYVKHVDSIYILLQIIIILWYTLIDKQWRMALKHKYQSMPCFINNRIYPTDDVMQVTSIRIYPTYDVMKLADRRMPATDDVIRGAAKEILLTGDIMEVADKRIHPTDDVMRGTDGKIHSTDDVRRATDEKMHRTDYVTRGADSTLHPTDDVKKRTDRKRHHTDDVKKRTDRKIHPTDDVIERTDRKIHPTDDVKKITDRKGHPTDDVKKRTDRKIYPIDDVMSRTDRKIHPVDDVMRGADRKIHKRDDVMEVTDQVIAIDDVITGTAKKYTSDR